MIIKARIASMICKLGITKTLLSLSIVQNVNHMADLLFELTSSEKSWMASNSQNFGFSPLEVLSSFRTMEDQHSEMDGTTLVL